MDSDHQELYLQKLQSFILDEDKVVTFPWLSKKLELDVNATKSLLQLFLTDHRSLKCEELGVTYSLLGTLKEAEVNCLKIVKEDELDEEKKLFINATENVFSIQKSKDVDLNIVSMVDMFDLHGASNKPLLGSVIGINCVKRNLKVKKALPEVSRAAPTDKSKASHLLSKTPAKAEPVKEVKPANSIAAKSNEGIHEKKDAASKSQSTKNSKAKPVQKGGLTNFFSKMPSKPESKPDIKTESTKLEGKADAKPESKPEKEPAMETKMEVDDEILPEASAPSNGSNKTGLYDSDTDEEAKKVEEHNKKRNDTDEVKGAKSTKKKKATKRRRKERSTERPQKRMKRIVVRNESDSDDIFGDDQDEHEETVICDSDDEPEVKIAKPVLAPKNKKRKYVDKTYTDEEGFVVTERVLEYESASEDEDDKEQVNPQFDKKPTVEKKPATLDKPVKVEVKKELAEVSPTKGVKGKKKGKQPGANQPTLMNFFKKK